MHTIVVVFAILAAVSAASVSPKEPIPIVSQEQEVGIEGTYKASYQTGNGITFEEQGVLKNAGQKENEAEEVHGHFSYIGDDGANYEVSYVADENGFQPSAAHLPVAPIDTNTPPPIPAEIVKSLEYNAAHPEENGKTDY